MNSSLEFATVEQVKAVGGYEILYADPPWSYADRGCNGAAAKEYKTMSFEDIAALPVEKMLADDAVLFLWATYPKLDEALALMPRWGFEFKSIAFQWVKTRGATNVCAKCGDTVQKPFLGLGRWTRGNTEPCLLGVRGKPKRIDAGVSQILVGEAIPNDVYDELLVAPVSRHSAKPPEARDRIVRLMGDQLRIELFARERAEGWDAWGNEVQSDIRFPHELRAA